MGLTCEQDLFIEALYRDMYKQLCTYANNALHDRGLAEEAVQDTFRIACSKPDDLMSCPNPRGWILTTLKHVIANIRRQRITIINMMISTPDAKEISVPTTTAEVDVEVLCEQVLGEEDYRIFRMIVFDKCTMLEAAQTAGISVEACKKRIQRAREKLKKLWKN